MSANTRAVVEDSTRLAIADLSGNCEQLIREGKRSSQMVNAFRNALQLFKENRLAGVVALQPISDPSELRVTSLLSIEVASYLGPRGKKWCRERGVKYLGELVPIKLDRRAEVSRELEEYILSLDLSPGMSLPFWQSPDADNPEVRRVLEMEIEAVFSHYQGHLQRCHQKGLHFTGQYLNKPSTSPADLRRTQGRIRPVYREYVRAGMSLPNWQAPQRVSPELPGQE